MLQVSRIFNAVSCEAFLRLIISTLVRGSSSDPMHGDDGDVGLPEATTEQGSDAAERDIRLQLCADALAGFAAVLGTHSLANEPDMLRRWGQRQVMCWCDMTCLGLSCMQCRTCRVSCAADALQVSTAALAVACISSS